MHISRKLNLVHGELVPTDEEVRSLQASVDQVISVAGHFTGIAERHPAGSFAKATMLRGRKEADVVAVLAQPPTDRTLEELRTHLSSALSARARRVATTHKAVRVEFTDDASIDLLPVARAGTTPPGPSVPRKLRHALSGIQHVAWAKREIHNSPRHQVIRLMKRLRDLNSDLAPLSSFAIEVLCVRSIPRTTSGLDAAVRLGISGVADIMTSSNRLPDPADANNDLFADVSTSQRAAITRCARDLLARLNGHRPESIFGFRVG